MTKKTLIKEKKIRNNNSQNLINISISKSKTHKKNRKHNTKNLKNLFGGADGNNINININKIPESNNFNSSEFSEEDLINNNNNMNMNMDGEEKQNIAESAVGSYNNPLKTKELSTLEKKQIEGRSGLIVQYPPIINTTKEEAMEAKLKNTREPGFTNYWEKIEDTLTPKYIANNFYPKYLISSSLSSNSNSNSNNLMGNNNLDDNLDNNFNLNSQENKN